MNATAAIRFNILKIAAALALTPAAMAFSGQAEAATFYVRTDGGDATQCNGTTDAAYPGAGTGQNCAWRHVYYALPTNGPARIAGGDTLIVGQGSYMIGWGAPGAAGGRCYDGGRYDCYLPPIPSGPSASQKTRILGKGHDTGCAVAPKLWGTERVEMVLNLQGSSNVEVSCLEITDQNDCVEHHSASNVRCQRDIPPYGQWASKGIKAKSSQNVLLKNINIHGMAHTGIHAGGLSNWTLQGVKINANGWVGWDGDIGAGSSNSGTIVMRDIEIAWNGCGEKWQTGQAWACWAQQAGGYGDGLGTAKTGGQWLIEDAFVHHNTSDGIDLLYMDGAATSSVTMRRVHAVGNAGNQLKMLGAGAIENSVVVGNCGYFNGRDYMTNGDHCRAQGNALSVTLAAGQTTEIRHNTIIGQGDCLIMTQNGDSASRVNIRNNALIGQTDYTSGGSDLACGHYADNSPASATVFSGNLFWNVKASQCPSGSVCGQDPKLTNMSMAAFDATPLAGSPLIDKVTALLTTDFLLQPRGTGASGDIGAIEVQSGGTTPPPPACTRAAPTVTMTGPANGAAGSSLSYTINVRNNDSSECASTTFNLARSVPANWTGTLSATTRTLGPGAQGSATLTVTSPTTAAAGRYTLGSGVSSSIGSQHTASASAALDLTTEAPSCTRATPTVSLKGPATAAPGAVVRYSLTVRNRDGAGCAATTFNLAKSVPAGWTARLASSTLKLAPGTQMTIYFWATSTTTSAPGTYAIGSGTASTAGSVHTASASTTIKLETTATGGGVLSGSVATDKTTYARGETVSMGAAVKRDGAIQQGATVVFKISGPNGLTWTTSTTTDENGMARATYAMGSGNPIGVYYVDATASYGNATGFTERNRFDVK